MNAYALVVGNANYTSDKYQLINAVNDARDLSYKLKLLGFVVNTILDCSVKTFNDELISFGQELNKYSYGLFYFAGHGFQIDGKNYLTGTDTSFADQNSVKYSAVLLDKIIAYMNDAKCPTKIIILDACRNNPLPTQFRSTNIEGLAPIYAPKGTIIAFSTSPGETALDGGAGNNSIYTGALLRHIGDANIPIEVLFKRVRTTVHELTHGKQTSWEHTSLIGDFYFNSGQLVHSPNLPYKNEVVMDVLFVSSGSIVDEIIVALKSHNYYTQNPAVQRLATVSMSDFDESSLFLLGRNILQCAIGGEFSSQRIMENLDQWLLKYFINEENHVLNGLLYEIYFNSKGIFRYGCFKADFIDVILALRANPKFNSSFVFILNQLKPFMGGLFYLPSLPPISMPIEILFEEKAILFGNDKLAYKLQSIKSSGLEFLKPSDVFLDVVNYNDFYKKLCKSLCVPRNMLQLNANIDSSITQYVYYPLELKLELQ